MTTLQFAVWLWLIQAPVHVSDRNEPAEDRRQRFWTTSAAIAAAAEGDFRRGAMLLTQLRFESHGARFTLDRCHLEKVRCDKGKAITHFQVWEKTCPGAWAAAHGSFEQQFEAALCIDTLLVNRARREGLQSAFCSLGASPGRCKWGATRARYVGTVEAKLRRLVRR